MLELDPELLERPSSRLDHQGDRVRGTRAVGVLDEVGVPGRDLRTPDPVPSEPTCLEHPAGGQLVLADS